MSHDVYFFPYSLHIDEQLQNYTKIILYSVKQQRCWRIFFSVFRFGIKVSIFETKKKMVHRNSTAIYFANLLALLYFGVSLIFLLLLIPNNLCNFILTNARIILWFVLSIALITTNYLCFADALGICKWDLCTQSL